MLENIIALSLVAAAGVYTIVWLRGFISGKSKCACGTSSCGRASPSCGSGNCAVATDPKPGSLPLINPSCGQGCGKR